MYSFFSIPDPLFFFSPKALYLFLKKNVCRSSVRSTFGLKSKIYTYSATKAEESGRRGVNWFNGRGGSIYNRVNSFVVMAHLNPDDGSIGPFGCNLFDCVHQWRVPRGAFCVKKSDDNM